MKKKEYVAPNVKVFAIAPHQYLLAGSVETTGLDGFDGYGGESEEDDEAD